VSPSQNDVLSPDGKSDVGVSLGASLEAPPVLPVFLKLAGRKVLLVGGGPVATSKFPALVAAGAQVTIVSPALHPDLVAAATTAAATIHQRGFVPEDLDGTWYVVAAAPPEVNRQVLAAAEPRCLFVNAVDDPAAATAYAGAVLQQGPVILAISTAGAAPALAGLLKEALAAILPTDIDRWGAVARNARAAWKRDRAPMSARRPLLLEALNRLYQTDQTNESLSLSSPSSSASPPLVSPADRTVLP
jgi:uroporphyrin-III C-methyltransferase/precorrin-2 dehydrogenase/sirohydrochlorin ferrochelatase